jgi:hypothetical protein
VKYGLLPPKTKGASAHRQSFRADLFLCRIGNCSITPDNSAWIAERASFRRYDFVDNALHFQVIPTKVGIQMFFFGVRLPSVIEQLLESLSPPRARRKTGEMMPHGRGQ